MGGLNFSQILIDCLKSGTPEKLAEANWLLNNVTVDVNATEEDGRKGTALIQTAYYGLPGWTEKLLERGAKVDTKDVFGHTALWYAALNGHTDVAVKLIQAGANIHIKDYQGYSPLDIAKSKKADEKIISLLRSYMGAEEENKSLQIIRSSDNKDQMMVLYQDQHIKG